MDKQKMNTPPRTALGKGLASLIPSAPPAAIESSNETKTDANDTSTHSNSAVNKSTTSVQVSATEESNKDRHPGISMCAVEDIAANEFQPRRTFDDSTISELAQSIKANGLIQPLIVRKSQKGYQLIAGERRWRAAQLAGLKYVPIVIRRTTDREALELALIENIQREDLNCIDTALAYYQLINDFDLKQDDLSERLGKDRTTIANHLRLLKLPRLVQGWLKDGVLSWGHGKALAGLDDASLVEKLANTAIEKKWSVRELENQIQLIKNLQNANRTDSVGQPLDPLQLRFRNLSKDLSKKFSAKVQIKGNDGKGKITIEYFNREGLDRVLNHLLEQE